MQCGRFLSTNRSIYTGPKMTSELTGVPVGKYRERGLSSTVILYYCVAQGNNVLCPNHNSNPKSQARSTVARSSQSHSRAHLHSRLRLKDIAQRHPISTSLIHPWFKFHGSGSATRYGSILYPGSIDNNSLIEIGVKYQDQGS